MQEPLPPTKAMTLEWDAITLTLEEVDDLTALAHKSVHAGTDPYWAYLWPSAQALMDAVAHLAQQQEPEPPHRAYVGQRVLDLGCGPGGAGVLAGVLGANVTLADQRPEAVALAARNAKRNGLEATALQMDWNDPPPDLGTFDAILAADVLYEDGMLRGVLRFIRKHLAPTGRAVIADPMRVEPAGIAGAGRLLGLQIKSHVARPGHTHTGGVTLYTVSSR